LLKRRAPITGLAAVTLALGVLALLTPFTRAESPPSNVGWLLAIGAAIEALHAFRRPTPIARRQGTSSAVISLIIALFLINAPLVAARALRLLVAGWFAIDAVRCAIGLARAADRTDKTWKALATLGNVGVLLLLAFARDAALSWMVTIAGALRIFGIAWNIRTAPILSTTDADESVLNELGLAAEPEALAMAADVTAAEAARAPSDRGWTIAFIATLFAIHVGRMTTDLTFLGLVSPGVAVLGDMLIALIFGLFVMNPAYLLWRGPTRWIERRVWRRHVRAVRSSPSRLVFRATAAWLRWRMAFAIRMRAARFSIPKALTRALQSGLPFAAILAATVPVWGMSWYFDTENWAAGMWNSWAASRTDDWRAAMVRAVLSRPADRKPPLPFAVEPPGTDQQDFSFIVIGDTGEGDASQHVLRDVLLSVANEPQVRFVVISSDVVYPTGAMKDYEAKFWLPFKGITKPVYAIPGNHDWYDALEGFAATFLQPDAARASIHARVLADLRVTSTTDGRIEDLIREADRLRQAYRVPTGFQRAPFFEVQADRFALVAIDTGVLRTIDDEQAAWLNGALDRAAGKFTMAIVGHPFFAGGHDVTAGDDAFSDLKALLLRRGVTIAMAGDTHDFEYYSDPGTASAPAVHYFVNGGGGAYLSFGTSLAWPVRAPTAEWAYYPSRQAVTGKIEAMSPWWKRPAWWWTTHFAAWPFSAEWLSAAFDYNVAPFFQSFVEVKVERSTNCVRVIPYGVHGRLAWRDVASSDGLPGSAGQDGLVEWIVPMTH
jgi:uncharacterized membrane protein HdeD (DUF308 family)